ncbi:hypothetical protein [Brevibacillus laterosporus]|uniref:hypothetical protein n=1 Tax=Brevibacillus laterosporus TaxID=1465 RepID=UPI003D256A7B
MIGFTNKCPHCGKSSSFSPEEMECDKSLVLWCNHCQQYISQTFTIETFRKWWARYDTGEDKLKPPISKEFLTKLTAIETEIQSDPECYLDKVEIHLKDFTDYKYSSEDEYNGQNEN